MSLEIKPAFDSCHPNTLSAIASEKRLEELKIINKRHTAELLQKSKERKIASDKKKRQLENKKWWQFWI